MNFAATLIMLLGPLLASAQRKTISLHVQPVSGKEIITPGKYYKIKQNDSFKITNLKFYLSNIRLLENNEVEFKEPNSFHLVDADDIKTQDLKLYIPADTKYNTIAFDLGIDSLTNTSGALGGDLDPTKGMYWTWQSGYINFKIEGETSLPEQREMELHIGGYQQPYNALQKVELKIKDPGVVNIQLNLSPFFESVITHSDTHIMSPGAKAVKIASLFAKCFKIN